MKKLLLAAAISFASNLYAQDTPLKDLKPVLAAVQVTDLDSSINFYSKYLGFQLTERKRFDDYHLEIAFLKSSQFEFELVRNDSAIDRQQVLKEKGVSEITGFAKLSFEIDHIDQSYDFLKSRGVNIVVPKRKSTKSATEQTFIIADPDGNWIQFTGP